MPDFLILLAAIVAVIWCPHIARETVRRMRYRSRAKGGHYKTMPAIVDTRRDCL